MPLPTAGRPSRSVAAPGLAYAARLAFGLTALALPALGVTVADRIRPGGPAEVRQAAVPSLPSTWTAAASSPVPHVRARRTILAARAE